ncbi:MAG TPA: response regulator [Gemmatimonadales bacterium]
MPSPRPPVLVVDDEEAIRLVIRRSLTRDDWSVEEAPDAAGALLFLRDPTRSFSAIILDHSLPDRSGLELHAELAAERPELAARVIFSTGAATPELVDTGRPLLQKPFEIAQLRALVREVAGG